VSEAALTAAAAAAAAVLSVRRLSLALGGVCLLRDVNLEVERGAIHALVGPNGAGKTSVLRSVLGELPHRGEIVLRMRPGGRIGYVPQQLVRDAELPLRVGEFLQGLLWRRPIPFGSSRQLRRRAAQLLEYTGAAQLLDRPLARLSGGELQRVLLAQALEPLPELLLLDEPVSHVDEAGARQLAELIRALARERQLGVLVVAHDRAWLAGLAERVSVLREGATVNCDPAQGLAAAAPAYPEPARRRGARRA
jgi:zinc transport system ATP-binding protein